MSVDLTNLAKSAKTTKTDGSKSTSSKTNSVKSLNSKDTKSKPSLFDMMVKSTSTDENKTKQTKTIQGALKTSTKTQTKKDSKNLQKDIKKDPIKQTKKEIDSKLTKSNISLLDKLVIDAKQTIKKNQTETKDKIKQEVKTKEIVIVNDSKKDISNKIEIKQDKKDISSPNKLKIEDKVKQEIKIENPNDNSKKEIINTDIISSGKKLDEQSQKQVANNISKDTKINKTKEKLSKPQITNQDKKITPQVATKEIKSSDEVKVEEIEDISNTIKSNKSKEDKKTKKTAHDNISNSNIDGKNLESLSLIDKIIVQNTTSSKNEVSNKSTKSTQTTTKTITQIDTKSKSTNKKVTTHKQTTITTKESFNASIVLSEQRVSKNITDLKVVKDSKDELSKQTVQSIKESANKLDLNLEDITIDDVKQDDKIAHKSTLDATKNLSTKSLSHLNLNNTLNKVDQKINNIKQDNSIGKILPKDMAEQNNILQDITLKDDVDSNSLPDKATKAKIEDKIIEVVVPNNAVKALQAKIIGARQQAGQFMSEIARNMYLNYKPPVTSFKMNLNPANLGSISVVMKSNKSSKSLDISMNMSNSNTLDAFNDNKSALQNALNRTFNTNNSSTNISLNFGMQSDSSNQSFEQARQQYESEIQDVDIVSNNQAVADEVEVDTASNDYM